MFKHQKRCLLFVALNLITNCFFLQSLQCVGQTPDWANALVMAIRNSSPLVLEYREISSLAFAANMAQKEGLRPEDILVAFDIDNTIATTIDPLASDQCFSEVFKATGRNLDKTLFFYFTRQRQTKLSPVESEYLQNPILIPRCFADIIQPLGTLGTIKFLQAFGIKTMGLTARSKEIIDPTICQLTEIGIDFTRYSPSTCEHNFDEPPSTVQIDDKIISIQKDCRYKNGILFCGNNSKGTKLLEFLGASNYLPKLIIFIDDKLKNITDVKKSIDQFNEARTIQNRITFLGIRYSRCDLDVAHFNLNSFMQAINSALLDLRRSPIPWSVRV